MAELVTGLLLVGGDGGAAGAEGCEGGTTTVLSSTCVVTRTGVVYVLYVVSTEVVEPPGQPGQAMVVVSVAVLVVGLKGRVDGGGGEGTVLKTYVVVVYLVMTLVEEPPAHAAQGMMVVMVLMGVLCVRVTALVAGDETAGGVLA